MIIDSVIISPRADFSWGRRRFNVTPSVRLSRDRRRLWMQILRFRPMITDRRFVVAADCQLTNRTTTWQIRCALRLSTSRSDRRASDVSSRLVQSVSALTGSKIFCRRHSSCRLSGPLNATSRWYELRRNTSEKVTFSLIAISHIQKHSVLRGEE